MIARHVTTHDEHGARLMGIGRDIYHTPTHSALDALAMELAARGRYAMYTQRHCLGGAVLSKTYPSGNRTIVDNVYFSNFEELEKLYERTPLGDGLFFEDAPWLERAFALRPPDIEHITAPSGYDGFTDALKALFTSEDMLAEAICALRRGSMPLALISDSSVDTFSKQLFMSLEIMLRALPANISARIEYATVCAGAPCSGVTGYNANENGRDCASYMYLPGGPCRIRVEPSQGDRVRAAALLSGSLSDILSARDADDSVAGKAGASSAAKNAAPTSMLDNADLEHAQQALSASLRYANSAEFRHFTADFINQRRIMGSATYFRHALMYSDYLHRIDHPMYELYDAELASLFNAPPSGLTSSQIARTISGYTGALNGAMRHIARTGKLDRFIMEAMPSAESCARPDEYSNCLLAARATLLECLGGTKRELVTAALVATANREMPYLIGVASAEVICSMRDALESFFRDDDAIDDGAFDPLISDLIEKIDFGSFDEYDSNTYEALGYVYSYAALWDGQLTDNQRAVCLWGRLLSGYAEWGGCVMEGVLQLIAPMASAHRDTFLQFVRRYFAALCEGGLDVTQMSESVVAITMLSALRFNAQGEWSVDELCDVLERLNSAGAGLECEFWQQVNTRVDLLPVNMLNAAHDAAGRRAESALKARRESAPSRPLEGHAHSSSDTYKGDFPREDYRYDGAPEYRRAADGGEVYKAPVRRRSSGYSPRHDENEARYRAHSRQYSARPANASAGAGSAREGDTARTRSSSHHSRTYDCGSDDPDGGYAGRRPRRYSEYAENAVERYRRANRRAIEHAFPVSGETLTLIVLLLLVVGVLLFCIINFIL